MRQVPSIRVVANLAAVAKDVERVLPLEHLLHEIGNDVAHGQLDVATQDLAIAQCASLADADTVERAHDRVGKPVLLVRTSREVLGRQLLKAICRSWGRDLQLRACWGWKAI